MALQLLNLPNREAGLGESFGQAVGGGLAGGLQALSEHKMNQLQKQNLIQGLQAAGYPKELANLPLPLLQAEMSNRGRQQTALAKHQLELQQQQAFERALQGYNQPQQQQQVPQQAQQPAMQQQYQPGFNQQFQQADLMNKLGFPTGLPKQFQSPLPTQNQQQQQPVPQQQAPSATERRAPKSMPIPVGLTPQQHMQYLSHVDRAQAQADASNRKYIDELQNGVKNAQDILGLVNEMDGLLSTGKVSTGVKGKVPLFLQNPETQQYAAKANELAILLASSQRGVPSAYRIRVSQLTKPSIEQNLLAQKGLQESVRKKAQDVIKRGDIVDQIITENGNYQPPNISSIVNNRYKQSTGQEASPLSEIKGSEFLAPISPSKEEAGESPIGTLVRGGLRTGARFLEPAGEQVQNLASLGLGAANYLSGGAIPTYGDLREKYPFLPPQQLSDVTNKITGGYLEPQNEVEQFIDNIAGTAGTLASSVASGGATALTKALSFITNPKLAQTIPKLVLPFSGIPWKKALGLGVASESVGKALDLIGASPAVQGLGKMATLLFGSTAGGKGAMLRSAEENYNTAKLAGEGKSVNIANAENRLRNLAAKTSKGFDPYKKIIEEVINEAENSLNAHKSGANQVPVNELVNIKQQANKWYGIAEHQNVAGEKHLPKGSKKVIGEIVNIINEPIAQYGLDNPSFGKPYAFAEDLWKGVHDVDAINKWISQNFSPSIGVKTELWKAFAKLGLSATAGKAAELGKFIRTPSTRSHFLKALKSAANQNKVAFGRELKILDREAQKEEGT